MIHDKICESRKVNSVDLYAEALWVRLLTKADDNGNYYRDVRRVHANCMLEKPDCSEKGTEKALLGLIKVGLIKEYEADGRKYIHLSDFHDWQDLRSDKHAQIDHPIHPTEMGGAYVGEGLRKDTWREQVRTSSVTGSERVGNGPVTAVMPVGRPEVEVKEEDQEEVAASNESETDEPQEDLGDWSMFVKDFHRAAGGVKTFARFPANGEKYQELCRTWSSDAVHGVIVEWVELKGGKGVTKRNQYACKNFLDDAEGLLEDRKSGPEPDDISKVAGPRGVGAAFAHLVKPGAAQ